MMDYHVLNGNIMEQSAREWHSEVPEWPAYHVLPWVLEVPTDGRRPFYLTRLLTSFDGRLAQAPVVLPADDLLDRTIDETVEYIKALIEDARAALGALIEEQRAAEA